MYKTIINNTKKQIVLAFQLYMYIGKTYINSHHITQHKHNKRD